VEAISILEKSVDIPMSGKATNQELRQTVQSRFWDETGIGSSDTEKE
jgi:hypothetical protein